MSKIKFQVETKRILEILSNDIYDSSYALLRENVQNAYDAILMRHTNDPESFPLGEGNIDVRFFPKERILEIRDNGIGMSEETLRENFWKAGSSGKRTELAAKAGVVGTFGIGAMANFGVAHRLEVITKPIGNETAFISAVNRDELNITEECIDFSIYEGSHPVGTTIRVILEQGQNFDIQQAIQYLLPYVKYIPVRLFLDGELISCESYEQSFIAGDAKLDISVKCKKEIYSAGVRIMISSNGQVACYVSDIYINGQPITGEIVVKQGSGGIMGLRNFFGLATIPVSTYYSLGGIVNLAILHPTAGREALSRESIDIVNKLINLIEESITDCLADSKFADSNTAFLSYIQAFNKYELAGNVKVQVYPSDELVSMSQINGKFSDKTLYYANTNEKQVIDSFVSGEASVLSISNQSPRRQVQVAYISDILQISALPKEVQIQKVYEEMELSGPEMSILFQLAYHLREDYLLTDIEVKFADLTHQVAVHVVNQKEQVSVYLQRNSEIIKPVLSYREIDYSTYNVFIKDFIRAYLYKRISDYVPSSIKVGADAFYKMLQNQSDKFTLERKDIGEAEALLSDYLNGDETLENVLDHIKKLEHTQSDVVTHQQVGSVETVIPDLIDSPLLAEDPGSQTADKYQSGIVYSHVPPIFRRDTDTEMKILTVSEQYPQLNQFTLFLSLSTRLDRMGDFFWSPHTTKVLWASHRIVYIFTRSPDQTTLYYDIELKDPIKNAEAGGSSFPTTTIITKSKIFVPIPPVIISAFEVKDQKKEFLIRFDII